MISKNMKELVKNNSVIREMFEEGKKLVKQYDTIVISNEVAGFSEDIIKKYKNNKNVKIVISFNKD